MPSKILSIEEKIPRPAKLPNGFYLGTWGAYIIEVRYKDKLYQLKTEEGVRGMNIRVVVEINDNSMSFNELEN